VSWGLATPQSSTRDGEKLLKAEFATPIELRGRRVLLEGFYKLRRGRVKLAERNALLLKIVVHVHEADPRMSDEEIESSVKNSLRALIAG
jgi:hypothetical protein